MKQIFQTHLRHGSLVIVLLSFISLSALGINRHKDHIGAVQRSEQPVLVTDIDLQFAPVTFDVANHLLASVFAPVQNEVKAAFYTANFSPQNQNYPAGRVMKHYETAYVEATNKHYQLNYNQLIMQKIKEYTYFKYRKDLAPLNRQLKPSLAQIQSFNC